MKKHTECLSKLKWRGFHYCESIICCNTYGWINHPLWKLNDLGKTDKPANLYTSPLRQLDACTRTILKDIGAVGHSFPKPRSYITCHYRFSDTLAIKRTGQRSCFQREAKRGTIWKISSLMLYFTFVFISTLGFVLRISYSFSPFPSSHNRQSRGPVAGCRWHFACQVCLCLTNGRLKQTQLKSLPITVAALASFYPKAMTFRGQSSVWGMLSLLLCWI